MVFNLNLVWNLLPLDRGWILRLVHGSALPAGQPSLCLAQVCNCSKTVTLRLVVLTTERERKSKENKLIKLVQYNG